MKESEQYGAVMRLHFAVIGLVFDDDVLIKVDYLDPDSAAVTSTNRTINHVCRQINDYCCGSFKDSQFDVNIRMTGTEFQVRVWSQLQKIAYGQVRTYGEIAKTLGTSPRAVGSACRANPVALLVPCHRVVASSGSMGGYLGETDGGMVAIKRWLLERENAPVSVSRLVLTD